MLNNRLDSPERQQPSPSFKNYIELEKKLARQASLSWEIPLDRNGVATGGSAWDLRKVLNDGNPTAAKLRTFSTVPKAVDALAACGILKTCASRGDSAAISADWQDLIKAYVLQQLMINGLSVPHVSSTCTAIRLIATVTNGKHPWTLTADDLQLCLSVAASVQPSGQSAVVIKSFVKTVLDAYHLVERSPLFPLLSLSALRQPGKFRMPAYIKKETELKSALQQRKSAEKLPEMRAFWELMRIVFTEQPRTFNDMIRFAQGKLLALTGLRIGEIALLPLDWKRTQDYHDRNGDPAGKHGGISRSIRLRHFAEKQGSSRKQVGTLWETSQYVQAMFESILCETLTQIERITEPMRRTLKAQCETGRLLPMYAVDQLVPAAEIYMHLTGMALTTDIPALLAEPYIERYRKSYDLAELDELIQLQKKTPELKTRSALYQFLNRLQKDGLTCRNKFGAFGGGVTNAFLRVDEVEAYIRRHTPTKVSDLTPFRLDGGKLVQPWEMLFLVPKRALGEGRQNIPCHVGRIIGIGVATSEILSLSLSADQGNAVPTLFENYGKTELDRQQTLLPHSLRHLQNTELFRLGVADTIITKRFNRRSVAQSYEYDHRSLQEELEQLTLPEEWDAYLGPKAGSVAKLILAGRANGPIVKNFKFIQTKEGDDAAYIYLKAEADGFHATPYGHCINSFTVDPCPTHLECFNDCMHLSATDLPENRNNLMVLQGKLKDALELARGRDSMSVGRQNQIDHAEVRLTNIARLLDTPPGERAFPNGRDLSLDLETRGILDGS